MLGAHLKIALRHLIAQKFYSALNLLGLAVGLACFILIALFVMHELGYDDHWERSDRIYRVSRDFYDGPQTSEAHFAGMAAPAAPLLEQDFAEIERAARVFCCGAVVRATDGGEPFLERGYAEADNALFEIFDLQWIAGDPETALTDPKHIVLTRSAAARHFGDADPIGRTLRVGGGTEEDWTVEVAGIIKDLPVDTHLGFSMLGSLVSWLEGGAERFFNNWNDNFFYTYVQLREGADIARVQSRSGEFFERHFEAGSSTYTGYTTMPIAGIHLRSDRQNEMRSMATQETGGSLTTVYTFGAIAVFILLIAIINFVNLATARSAQHAKEIGLRKIVGAERRQVIAHFLAAAVLMSALAVAMAVALVELALPAFNAFLGLDLELEYLGDMSVAGSLVALALATGLAAGSYPAFHLSAFRPAHVLRGRLTRGTGAVAFRRTLVVLQFSISIALLIGTIIVYQQMRFVRSIELGFDKDRIVIVSPNNVEGDELLALEREWLADQGITAVTWSNRVPFQPNPDTAEVRPLASDPPGRRMKYSWVADDFFATYGMEIVAGRSFSRELDTNAGDSAGTRSYVISELAARELGWSPAEAVGQWLEVGAIQDFRGRRSLSGAFADAVGVVVGVVGNAYFESVHNAVSPMVYWMPQMSSGALSLRVSGRDLAGTLEHIEASWKKFRPNLPVSPRFLDQDFDALYRAEQRESQMLTAFAALAILIACLGLFGLAAFATERRTKEIGVRKVMGATVRDVVALFTGELGKLVLVANLVAWPAAYFLMRRWLESFAYRIDMSLFAFASGALVTLVIAWLTVGAVAARAAAMNPVESLRYE